MSVFHVCRLCSSKNELMWLFNKETETGENIQDVIYIVTGVEIQKTDFVSQKICEDCTQFTIAVFKFREKCIENDRRLKDTFNQYLNNGTKIPNTDVTIEIENKKSQEESKQLNRSAPQIHPSIRDLFKIYPQLKLPTACLNYHVSPHVSMPIDEVENYFKNRILDINEYIKLAKSKKADRKTPTNFGIANSDANSSISSATTDFVIDAEIISDENEDDDTGIIRPIKIKIIPRNSVHMEMGKDNADNSLKNNGHDGDIKDHSDINALENPQIHRKRKFSEVDDERPNKEKSKADFVDTLELTPKVDTHSPDVNSDPLPLLSYIDKSISLHICNICNSVNYSAKELRKHQLMHLRCQFCKLKFRNLESRLLHLENTCVVKNAINLPDIEVQRIEYDSEIRKKYPGAFRNFPAFKNGHNDTNNVSNEVNHLEIAKSLSCRNISLHTTDHSFKDRHITAEDVLEIIEILSDDEAPPNAEATNTKITLDKTFENITLSQAQNRIVSSSPAEVVNRKLPSSENVNSNIDEVVEPIIKITNCSSLINLDSRISDVEVIRTVLSNIKSLPVFAEKTTQTYLPTNQSIFINLHDSSAELKNLKQLLSSYIIPIVIKEGRFNVTYNYKLDARKPKRLCLWNDLKPIDMRSTNKSHPMDYNIIRMYSEQNNNNSNGHPTSVNTSLQRSHITNLIKTYIVHKNPSINNLVQTQNSLTLNHQVVGSSTDLTCINSIASNMTLPQQHSLTSKPQAIITPIPVSSCTSLSASNMYFPQQGVIRVKDMSELI